MKIIHKKRFIFFILLYVIGYLYFCVFGSFINNLKVGDTLTGRYLIISDFLPATAYNLSTNIAIFVVVSFFLILFIVWQTNLEGPKLNRTVLLVEGLNIYIICLSFAIVDAIVGNNFLSTAMIITITITVVYILGFLIAYLATKNKKKDYTNFMDIMTKEEYDAWQNKKLK